jgi:hypothetical protein
MKFTLLQYLRDEKYMFPNIIVMLTKRYYVYDLTKY